MTERQGCWRHGTACRVSAFPPGPGSLRAQHVFDADEARYLFVRLFIRKNGWFRIDKLGYQDEIGNVKRASDTMCLPILDHLLKARQAAESKPTGTSNAGTEGRKPGASVECGDDAPTAGPSRVDHPEYKPALDETPRSNKDHDTGAARSIRSPSSQPELDEAMMELSKAIDEATAAASLPPATPVLPKSQETPPISLDAPIPDFSSDDPESDLSSFAVSSSSLTEIDELLGCVSLDELKLVAKDMKIHKPGTTKEAIVESLKKATKSQSTLFASPSIVPGGRAGDKTRQLSLTFNAKGVKQGQTTLLAKKSAWPQVSGYERLTTALVLRIIGPCVKLRPGVISLFSRLHLIFHRSFDLSDKTMTASMLARFKIRTYPTYIVKRTFAIFPSRQALLEYEAALQVEKEMEFHLGDSPDSWKPKGSTKGLSAKEKEEEAEKEKRRKMEALKNGLELFDGAWKHWKAIVKREDGLEAAKIAAGEEEESEQYRLTYYRKRFNCGPCLLSSRLP